MPSARSSITAPSLRRSDDLAIADDNAAAILVMQLQHELQQVRRSRASLALQLDALLQYQHRADVEACPRLTSNSLELKRSGACSPNAASVRPSQPCRADHHLQTSSPHSISRAPLKSSSTAEQTALIQQFKSGKQRKCQQTRPEKPAIAQTDQPKGAPNGRSKAEGASLPCASANLQGCGVLKPVGRTPNAGKGLGSHKSHPQRKGKGQHRGDEGDHVPLKALVPHSKEHVPARQIFPAPRSLTAKAIVEANHRILRESAGFNTMDTAESAMAAAPTGEASAANTMAALHDSSPQAGMCSEPTVRPMASARNVQRMVPAAGSSIMMPDRQESSQAGSNPSSMSWLQQGHDIQLENQGLPKVVSGTAQNSTCSTQPIASQFSSNAPAAHRSSAMPLRSLMQGHSRCRSSGTATDIAGGTRDQLYRGMHSSADKALQAFASNAARLADAAASAAGSNTASAHGFPQERSHARPLASHQDHVPHAAASPTHNAVLALAHNAAALDHAASLAARANAIALNQGHQQATYNSCPPRRQLHVPSIDLDPQDSAALISMEAGQAMPGDHQASSASAPAGPGLRNDLDTHLEANAGKSSLQVSASASGPSIADMQPQLSRTLDQMELGSFRPSVHPGQSR